MIVPEIKAIVSAKNMDYLNTISPENPNCFCEYIEVAVGEKGKEGSDNFTFIVCNPEYLKNKSMSDELFFLRHYILVEEFNPQILEKNLEKLISSISGKDWNEYANKLARYGKWEFEDFQER